MSRSGAGELTTTMHNLERLRASAFFGQIDGSSVAVRPARFIHDDFGMSFVGRLPPLMESNKSEDALGAD